MLKCTDSIENGYCYITFNGKGTDKYISQKLKIPFDIYIEVLELSGARKLSGTYWFDDDISCEKAISILIKLTEIYDNPIKYWIKCKLGKGKKLNYKLNKE